MNKQDLVRSATERLGLSRKDAVELVDGLFDDIQAAVVSGDAVKIPGFGQFKVRDRGGPHGTKSRNGSTSKSPRATGFQVPPRQSA